jgi:hypothetical protein
MLFTALDPAWLLTTFTLCACAHRELRIESPPSGIGKHLCTPECCFFAFTTVHLCNLVRLSAIEYNFCLAVILKQLTLVAAWAIASRTCQWAVCCNVPRHFSSGRMASGDLPAVHTHTRTKYKTADTALLYTVVASMARDASWMWWPREGRSEI